MISLSKIVSNEATVSKELTFKDDSKIPKGLLKFVKSGKPVVVWNITRRCNLNCIHCYSAVENLGEMKKEECLDVIDKMSSFGVPILIFGGGEPLMREDLFEIARYAKKKGIRVVLSTNGTLISRESCNELKVFDYVGVSFDGVSKNDQFRGVEGAFEKALNGLKLANEITLTGIRFTITKYNFQEIFDVLNLAREHEIPRFCVYHLVPSGKADFRDDISNEVRRWIVDKLMLEAEKGGTEILTVDNPADGIYAYLKMKRDEILEFLKYRGGDGSGFKIVCIDPVGNVHPNQFWHDYTAGNIIKQSFDEIMKDELFQKLKMKEKFLTGKCGICKFKSVCGGFRVRAYRAGNLWGEDPSCYLSLEEICF
ncbi:MAG: radical SAM protein [Archaeoglobaceae archaeon]|nr:radical SAM protein [Archaeoglobaceae archaeon]MCX8152707.1 radical SAM protein [Archaeoglobaceae archaeon]MDW8013413.1 radical SAM protein [Archaeoglobaceae archaeon]